MKKSLAFLCLAVLGVLTLSFLTSRGPVKDNPVQIARLGPPLSFEPNMGQAGPEVEFISRAGNGVLAFKKDELEIKGKDLSIKMGLAGAKEASIYAEEKLAGISNYYRGNDPAKWVTGVPHYGKLVYKEVYPGIDLAFYGNGGRLEYDFIVSPGASPERIELAIGGADLRLDKEGNLLLTKDGSVLFRAPRIYQETDGVRKDIKGNFLIKGKDRAAFQVASYDPAKTLVIDPELVFSTFLGGTLADEGRDIAVDASGNIYVTGFTISGSSPIPQDNFPTQNAFEPDFQGGNNFGDAFVSKFNPGGTALVYSTFLGGPLDEAGNGIAIDGAGNAYVTGFTESLDFFPVLNNISNPGPLGSRDIFISKFSPSGGLLFSSRFGGTLSDNARDIAVDNTGSTIYITGISSLDFPTDDPVIGLENAFVLKLVSSGLTYNPDYSRVISGAQSDIGSGIAIDSAGTAYVVGSTASINLPVTGNAFQPAHAGGVDAFIAKFDVNGNKLYLSFFGGGSEDTGEAIAVDTTGFYIAGSTTSSDNFPLQGDGFDQSPILGIDAFISKLNPSGDDLIYSTFIGGSVDDEAMDLKIDQTGIAYLTGRTDSLDFPLEDDLQTPTLGTNIFLSKLSATGDDLLFSTQLGGNAEDEGLGLFVDQEGNAYITGLTSSFDLVDNLPPAGFQSDLGGVKDAFVIKASLNNPPTAPVLVSPEPNATGVALTPTFEWQGSTDPDGDTISGYTLSVCLPATAAGQNIFFFAGLPSTILFGIVLISRGRRRRFALLAILLLGAFAVSSCGGGGGDGEIPLVCEDFQTAELSFTIEEPLQPDTLYTWRVTATDSKGADNQSASRQFTTAGP